MCDVLATQSPSVRMQCSTILLQFLLDYPLGTKRLQHHLNFLVSNLSYEHESGRETTLHTLKASTILLMILSSPLSWRAIQ
jgi:U3 small nucleolar RNA-associated protein 20